MNKKKYEITYEIYFLMNVSISIHKLPITRVKHDTDNLCV